MCRTTPASLDLCARVEAKMWKVVDREAYIRALQDIMEPQMDRRPGEYIFVMTTAPAAARVDAMVAAIESLSAQSSAQSPPSTP
jgi:hypothetical protein